MVPIRMSPDGMRKFESLTDRTTSSTEIALRVEEVAVQVDGDLPDLAAVDVGGGDAVDPLDLGLDRVVGDVVELLLVDAAARDGDEADRDVREVGPHDERLLDAGGQGVADLLDALDDLVLAAFRSAS